MNVDALETHRDRLAAQLAATDPTTPQAVELRLRIRAANQVIRYKQLNAS